MKPDSYLIQETIREFEIKYKYDFQKELEKNKIAYILEDFFMDLGIALEKNSYIELLQIIDSFCLERLLNRRDLKEFDNSKEDAQKQIRKAIAILKKTLGKPEDYINIADFDNQKPEDYQKLHIVKWNPEDYQTTLDFLSLMSDSIQQPKRPKKISNKMLIENISKYLETKNIPIEKKALNNLVNALKNCKSFFKKL